MATLNGNNVYLSLDGVNVSAYWTDEVSFSESNNTVEVTAGAGATDVERASGLRDTTLSLVVVYDDANLSTYLSKMAVGSSYTVIYGPESNTTGKPKHEQTMILQTMDGPNPTINKDMVSFSLSFQGAATATARIANGDTF